VLCFRRTAVGLRVVPGRFRLLAADRACARELAWRNRVDLQALELERPGWLRELGEPPATIKGRHLAAGPPPTSCSTASATRSPTPTTRSGPSRAAGTWSSAATIAPPHQAIERLQARQPNQHEQRHDRHEHSRADQQPNSPSRADRSRSASVDERHHGAREREAG
jgi:hypothetical protein